MAANLPQFQSDDRPFQMMQNQWASILTPVLNSPIVNGRLITGQALINGATTINHRLDRKLQGWVIVGNNAAATIYDSQTTNTMPDKTLILNSSAACIVAIWVF